jgi:hypothetical protein
MIIEFTGAPGSGKTTAIKKLLMADTKLAVLSDTDFLKSHFNIPPFLWGIITEDLILFSSFILNFNKFKNTFAAVLKQIKKVDTEFLFKLNILRNTIKKFGKYQILKQSNAFILVDEGISHLFQNIFVGNRSKKVAYEDISSFFEEIYPFLEKVIILGETKEVLIKRNIDRKVDMHRRMKGKPKEEIDKFINEAVVILQKFEQEIKYRNHCYIYVKNTSEIQQMKQILNFLEKQSVQNSPAINL